MKRLDEFQVWEPMENLSRDLYFNRLEHRSQDLIVWLKELGKDDKELKITFENVVGYRVFPEESRLKTIHEVPSFGGFKKSTSSEFLKWYEDETKGMFEDWEIVHYLICNIDNIIDILSRGEVKAEWNLDLRNL